MNTKKKFDILKNMFNSSDLSSLMDLIIYDTKNGYELFGEYAVTKKNNQFIVTKKKTDLKEVFYNKKLAVVWVTMYKRNRLTDANRIKDLDIMLEGAEVSLEQHKKLHAEATDLDKKSLNFIKLQEDRVKKNAIIEELDRYVLNARNWQLTRFKEATK
jgi:hypothetical protein